MNLSRLALLGLLLAPAALWAAADVTVVVDMTAEGRKVARPTADHPAYYFPSIGGYKEYGDVSKDLKPPSAHDIVKIVAPELARQGYRAVDNQHPRPDLMLDIGWGSIAPTVDTATADVMDSSQAAGSGNARNESQRLALVAGNTFSSIAMPESYGHDGFMEAANDSRYYIIVGAYDFAAWEKDHKRVLLWKAKMSIPMDGVTFGDVLVSLIKAGGPQFGRETVGHPVVTPGVPEGHVEVGTPTVKDDVVPAQPAPSSAPATKPAGTPPPK